MSMVSRYVLTEIEKEVLYLLQEYDLARQNRILNAKTTSLLKMKTSDGYAMSVVFIHGLSSWPCWE